MHGRPVAAVGLASGEAHFVNVDGFAELKTSGPEIRVQAGLPCKIVGDAGGSLRSRLEIGRDRMRGTCVKAQALVS